MRIASALPSTRCGSDRRKTDDFFGTTVPVFYHNCSRFLPQLFPATKSARVYKPWSCRESNSLDSLDRLGGVRLSKRPPPLTGKKSETVSHPAAQSIAILDVA